MKEQLTYTRVKDLLELSRRVMRFVVGIDKRSDGGDDMIALERYYNNEGTYTSLKLWAHEWRQIIRVIAPLVGLVVNDATTPLGGIYMAVRTKPATPAADASTATTSAGGHDQ